MAPSTKQKIMLQTIISEKGTETHTYTHTSTQEGVTRVAEPAIQQDFEALSLSLP